MMASSNEVEQKMATTTWISTIKMQTQTRQAHLVPRLYSSMRGKMTWNQVRRHTLNHLRLRFVPLGLHNVGFKELTRVSTYNYHIFLQCKIKSLLTDFQEETWLKISASSLG